MVVSKKAISDAAPDTSEEFDEQPAQLIASEPVTVDAIKERARTGMIPDFNGQPVPGAITHVGPALQIVSLYVPHASTGKTIALGNGWITDDLATGVPYRAGTDRGTHAHYVNGTLVDEPTLARMLERHTN